MRRVVWLLLFSAWLVGAGCSDSVEIPPDAPTIPPGRSAVGPEDGEQDPVLGARK